MPNPNGGMQNVYIYTYVHTACILSWCLLREREREPDDTRYDILVAESTQYRPDSCIAIHESSIAQPYFKAIFVTTYVGMKFESLVVLG